ncbi:MAG: hypothetical protein K5651_08710 [Bacteroidales bacterium]|nr:hypothetical protein [Bacteroidales bacterium]
MMTLSKFLCARLAVAALLLPFLFACSKETPAEEDRIAVIPSGQTAEEEQGEEQPQVPSKYKEEDLITVSFTADAEGTKTILGDNGSGAGGTGRSVTWEEGDQVSFVWGPDEEDHVVGTASSISEDGKRATFTVSKVYSGAKAIYAVSPAGALDSFTIDDEEAYEEDGTGTVRVRVGSMADGSKPDGGFGDADVCIARTSLESHKMKFKHLVAFVSVTATHLATGGARLDAGEVAVGGVLPVTVGVGADDYTATPVVGAAENTVTSVDVLSAGLNTPTYIPVLPGLSFSDGVTLSYLDSGGAVIGSAKMKKNVSVSLGSILSFISSINSAFSKDYYVKSGGTGDGSSWDNAWGLSGLEAYLETANGYETTGNGGGALSSAASINIHIAAGTYAPTTAILARGRYTSDELDTWRNISLIGGYPSDITDANAASKPRDPSTNATTFSGSSIPTSEQGMIYVQYGGAYNFSGLTFSGRSSTNTGYPAVYLKSAGSYSLEAELHGCTFSGNTNTNVSAGLMLNSGTSDANLLVEDCSFTGNSAGAGAALSLSGENAYLTARRCSFTSNTTTHYYSKQDGGSAVKVEGATSVFEDCLFSDNKLAADAVGNGGAVWIIDSYTSTGRSVSFTNCTFEENYVQNALSKGGAVWVERSEQTTFTNCTFSGNYCADATSTTSYAGAILVGNKLESGQGNYHTTIGHDVSVALNNCTFDGNHIAANKTDASSATVAAGAIYLYQPEDCTVTLTISGGSFVNHDDNTDLNGGAIYQESGTLTMGGKVTFSGNKGYNGGALYCAGGSTTLENVTFNSNIAAFSGGAVSCQNGATFLNCSFRGNSCGSRGGAVYVIGSADTRFIGGDFTSNSSASQGGAIHTYYGATANLYFSDVLFEGNSSTTSGGGAFCASVTAGNLLSFSRCQFKNNIAGNTGGALCNYKNANLTVENCTFTGNEGRTIGGAIYHAGEDKSTNTLTVSGGSFGGNNSLQGGGAIYIGNASKVRYTAYSISGASFVNNSTTSTSETNGFGGAVAALTSGAGVIHNCSFTGNYTTNTVAEASGGACFLFYGNSYSDDPSVRGSVSVSGCTFSGNHTGLGTGYCQARGGAIAFGYKDVVNHLDARVDKCNFIGNYATQGGAILVHDKYQSAVYLNDCLFEGNYTGINFGTTLFCYSGGNLGLNNCTFHNSWCTDANKYITQLQWLNLARTNVTMSNCTLIGQPQRYSGDTNTYSNGCTLIRLEWDVAGKSYHFINNIIGSPGSWCYAMHEVGSESTTLNLYSNKMSPLYGVSATNTDSYNATDFYGTSSYFGSLAWNTGTSKYNDTGWSWNGSLATGSVTTMNTRSDIKSKINMADSDFYDWLSSIGALGSDQRGQGRGVRSWPGAWQESGSELPSGVTDIAAANSRAAGLSRYETANCYVINAAGKYAFPADIRGNGVVAGSGESPATNSGIASAAEVWDDNNIVKSVSLHTAGSGQQYVIVETPSTFAKGNALVAVKNSSNQIVWSWHIWATSYRPGQDDQLIEDEDYGSWYYMPLELGMTDTDQTACTLYQWGRKDPFRYQNPSRTTENHLYISTTIRNPDWYYTPSASVYAIKNPESAGVLEDESLWNPGNSQTTTVKTMLDPCPPGYYVMPFKAAELMLKDGVASVTERTQVTLNNGISMRYHAIINGSSLVTSWPNYYFQISHWHADIATGKQGSSNIRGDGTTKPIDGCGCGFGFPVRAVRDGN